MHAGSSIKLHYRKPAHGAKAKTSAKSLRIRALSATNAKQVTHILTNVEGKASALSIILCYRHIHACNQ